MSSLGEGEGVTETSNNNTSDLSGLSRLHEKEEMMKGQVTSPPTVSPTISQPRVKSRATPSTLSGGSSKSVTSLPNISPTPKSLLPGLTNGPGDISRPQSTSSRSSCEYQQSPGSGQGEFVSPEYRRGSGYFRSYNVQQAGYYGQYQPAYTQTNPAGQTGAAGAAGPYRQNMQGGGEQYGGYTQAGHYPPTYPAYEGGQEMSGYYPPSHPPSHPHSLPHTTNTNYSKQSYSQHYAGYSESKAGYYYQGAACQPDNTPLPPDFTYVGSAGSNEASSAPETGYQHFYAC